MTAPFIIGSTHVLTWSAYKQLGSTSLWTGTWAIYPKQEPYFTQYTVAGEAVEGSFATEAIAERAAFAAGSNYLERLEKGIPA